MEDDQKPDHIDGVQFSIASGPTLLQLQPNYGIEEMAYEYKIIEYGTFPSATSPNSSSCNNIVFDTKLRVRPMHEATHVNARRDRETEDLRAEMECHIRREIATSQASQTTLRYNGDTRYSSSGFPGRDMAPPPAKVSTLEWKRYPSPAACLDLPSHIASLSASRASTRPRRWCAASTRRGRRRRRT